MASKQDVRTSGDQAGVAGEVVLNRAPWYGPPQLMVMTGFIANTTNGVWGNDFVIKGEWSAEQQQAALAEWNKDLGRNYDAEKAIQAFKDAGASVVGFYDKWHDGLIPHATRLTGFRTERDLVGETMRAANKVGMARVLIYSVGLDYNPEERFLEWSCRDHDGEAFGMAFPSDWKSFHSPYRQYVIDQLVEMVKDYGPLEGLFLDLFTQPSPRERLCEIISPRPSVSYDRFTEQAYLERFGKPLGRATGDEIEDFVVDTLRDFLLEIRAEVSAVQPGISLTFNGAGMDDIVRPRKAWLVDGQADWFSMEGHTPPNIDRGARLARAADRPFDVGMLLNSSWYVPTSNQAPPPAMSESEAIVRAATAWIQGANVFAAVAPGHSGTFDDTGDLGLLRAIGGWLNDNRPWLTDSLPYSDVGILTGAPSCELDQIPLLADLWESSHRAFQAGAGPYDDRPGYEVGRGLRDCGYFTERVGGSFAGRQFDLASYRMLVVPETALLDEDLQRDIREYVGGGGNVLAFGHASLFDSHAAKRADFSLGDVFGVRLAGPLPGYKQLAVTTESGLTSAMPRNPGALEVQVTTGEVLATWRGAGDSPAIVENRFGEGVSLYVSAEEIPFGVGSSLLRELALRMIGPRPVTIDGERDYDLLMNRTGEDLLLYILNRDADAPGSQTPDEVHLTVDTSILEPVVRAELNPSRTPIVPVQSAGLAEFSLQASPAVTSVRLVRG